MVLASISELSVIVAIVIGYALGTVPGATIVARRHGVDLRTTGDGNPGAWNALEQLGWRRAWPVFAIDGLKGLLAAVVGWAVFVSDLHLLVVGSHAFTVNLDASAGLFYGGGGLPGPLSWAGGLGAAVFGDGSWSVGAVPLAYIWLPWACVAAAMLGHAFPFWAPRSGGKAVMTLVGGGVGLVPLVGVPLLALFGVFAWRGRAALGARLGIIAFPLLQALVTPLIMVAWTGLLMTLMGAIFLLRSGDRRAAPA